MDVWKTKGLSMRLSYEAVGEIYSITADGLG